MKPAAPGARASGLRDLVRSAERQDLDQLADLELRAFKPPANRPWSKNEIAAELAPERIFLVAAPDDGPILGYCLFRILGDEAELLRMATAPEARRRGLGRALLTASLERLQDKIRRCLLEVRADNLPAMALYESFGFSLEGRRAGYYPDGVDALLFSRKLQREHA